MKCAEKTEENNAHVRTCSLCRLENPKKKNELIKKQKLLRPMEKKKKSTYTKGY